MSFMQIFGTKKKSQSFAMNSPKTRSILQKPASFLPGAFSESWLHLWIHEGKKDKNQEAL